MHWLLFIFLTIVSLYLLVLNTEFQRSKYLTVFLEISGRVYSVSNSVQSYVNLKKDNTDLLRYIATLEEEIQIYQNEVKSINEQAHTDLNKTKIEKSVYTYIPARVKYNQVSGTKNFIILDKGSNDGIVEDMAVVSVKGIVGVIREVSANFSRVIPLLNANSHPSGMIKNTRFSGLLSWDGKDPGYITLSGLPSHAIYEIGDTIITSGYSISFPEGVLIGVIDGTFKQKNEDYLKIRLFTDFSTLNEVLIISNPFHTELTKIMKGMGD